MNVVDQPGYVPTPDEEQLSGSYEKQEVFFRISAAPGTIIIDTNQRFLLISCSRTIARCAMVLASAARASSGLVCRRYPASRNGRTGVRRRR